MRVWTCGFLCSLLPGLSFTSFCLNYALPPSNLLNKKILMSFATLPVDGLPLFIFKLLISCDCILKKSV
jgi:hypothetical protein